MPTIKSFIIQDNTDILIQENELTAQRKLSLFDEDLDFDQIKTNLLSPSHSNSGSKNKISILIQDNQEATKTDVYLDHNEIKSLKRRASLPDIIQISNDNELKDYIKEEKLKNGRRLTIFGGKLSDIELIKGRKGNLNWNSGQSSPKIKIIIKDSDSESNNSKNLSHKEKIQTGKRLAFFGEKPSQYDDDGNDLKSSTY